MSVWLRQDGRYGAKLLVPMPDGSRRVVQATASSRKEAVSRVEERRRRLEAGKPARDSMVTVAEVARRWLEVTLPASDRSPTTKDLYAGEVRRHILGETSEGARSDAARRRFARRPALLRIGTTPLKQLTASDVEGFLLDVEHRGYSVTSRRRLLQILRAVLDTAVRDGKVARNVARDVSRPTGEAKEAEAYSAEDVRRLVAHVKRQRLGPLVELLAHTGLRIGEALALRWQDVNLDEPSCLRVRGSLVRTKGAGLTVSPGKTTRARRTVPLDAAAADALRRWKAAQRKERLRAGSVWQTQVDWLFTTETGTPLDVRNVGRWYAAEARAAGVGGTPHRLRHTFASLLLADGESVRNVAELLGHSKTSTTWDTYGHVAVETQRAAVQRLSGLLGG